MMSEKEPEQILREVFDLLAQLEKVKVKTEWPAPVKKDRNNKLAEDYTVKDWYLKEQEELGEFYNEVTHYVNWDEVPRGTVWDKYQRERVLEEACDQIHTIFSKLHQFGYTEDEIAAGIHKSNEKAKERGLID